MKSGSRCCANGKNGNVNSLVRQSAPISRDFHSTKAITVNSRLKVDKCACMWINLDPWKSFNVRARSGIVFMRDKKRGRSSMTRSGKKNVEKEEKKRKGEEKNKGKVKGIVS